GVLLYGMSLLYGTTGTTKLTEIGAALAIGDPSVMQVLAVVLVITGFAFKISAVPFHTWAPDTYQGAPTPVTAFLSVASKAAGFTALLTVLYLGLYGATGVHEPYIWVLAALTMTIGNVVALRQTNIVRMLAYSSVSQGGFILMPLAVMATDAAESALRAVVIYLLIYAFSNLGAFCVIMAVARKTRSGEISSFGGLMGYAPGLGVLMTVFLASLAGIPPLGIWIAKLQSFRALIDAGSTAAYALAVIAAVNTVIAAAYYMRVLRQIWMAPAPDGDTSPVVVPPPIRLALAITAGGTVVLGILPGLVLRFADLPDLTGALGF
ncbi:MAG: NADH-quinone oxidoreductase subunit N, partial [Ilumatobacteraceae bacterium]